MKYLTLVFALFLSLTHAEVVPPKPAVETVPEPTVEKTSPVQDDSMEGETGVNSKDLGLIKTEKTYKDKNCKVFKGGDVVCKKKKKVKRKTL